MSDFIRHYAIFWSKDGIALWQRSRTKKEAIKRARQTNGIVYKVNYDARVAWDAPTFRACGDKIYPLTAAERFAQHRQTDPHCTCPDCLNYHADQTES